MLAAVCKRSRLDGLRMGLLLLEMRDMLLTAPQIANVLELEAGGGLADLIRLEIQKLEKSE